MTRSAITCLVVGVVALGSSLASSGTPAARTGGDAPPVVPTAPPAPGVQRLQFEAGPFDVRPGQNSMANAGFIQKPQEAGYVVGIIPNIRDVDGSVPPVDVIHLHHGVWFNNSNNVEPFLAVGEEKTALRIPEGYGYPFEPTDLWTINLMIHNATAAPADIWITYEVDFLPATAPAANNIVPVRPIYMDVQNGHTTFDVLKGSARTEGSRTPIRRSRPTADTHPRTSTGSTRTACSCTRPATSTRVVCVTISISLDLAAIAVLREEAPTTHLFESKAHYYEPAGPVSWDLSMTATRPGWRVGVREGDVLRITSTYETKRASWHQAMGLMIVWMANGESGPDPFTKKVDQRGVLTHGRLPENSNHGGKEVTLRDATKFPSKTRTSPIPIDNFFYGAGDMTGKRSIPRVKAGERLTFVNKEASDENGIWHTITGCRAPCNRETGVAYPLADGEVEFDSGELGLGGWPTADRIRWSTPKDLPVGTYTYFCRIHPFMRGAFEIAPNG